MIYQKTWNLGGSSTRTPQYTQREQREILCHVLRQSDSRFHEWEL